MVERTGIYVGNKEISERYVGNKLVWGNWIYIGQFTIYGTASRATNTSASVYSTSLYTRFTDHPRYSRQRTQKVKLVDADSGRFVYAKFIYVDSGTATQRPGEGSGVKIVIEFNSNQELEGFMNSWMQRIDVYIR